MVEYEISHLLIISAHPQPQQQLQFSHCDKCIAKTRRLCQRGGVRGTTAGCLLQKKQTKKRARAFAPITQFQFLVCTYTHTHTHSAYKKLSTSMCVCVCEHVQEVNKKHKKQSKLQYSKKKKRQHCFVVVNNKFSSCAKWWHTFTHRHKPIAMCTPAQACTHCWPPYALSLSLSLCSKLIKAFSHWHTFYRRTARFLIRLVFIKLFAYAPSPLHVIIAIYLSIKNTSAFFFQLW